MTSAACSPANPPFQFGEYCPDGAAGMWQQAAQQPQLAFVPTAADYAACEPVLAASYPVAAGWQQQGQAYPGYLPMMPGAPQPVGADAQQAADALGGKKRLRWSAALHARFVDAVKQLGGALQATPKRIQLLMAVPGLSLLHVKSHLQKYRNALSEGRPPGPRGRPAGVACRRRGVMSKRSAATMRSTGSNGDGGSGSDGEWEEDTGSGAGSGAGGAGSPTVGLGLGGFPEQLSRRNSKHFRASQPEEAAPEQQAAAAAHPAMQQGGAAAAAAAGMGLEPGSMGHPLPSLSMGWGTASDFAAVEAELEAALAPVDAQLAAIGPEADGQCGTDDEDGALLDLPEGLAMLDRQLSSEAAQGHSAGAKGTRGATDPCPSGSGGQSSSSGLALTMPLAVTASPSILAGPTAPALPDAADAVAQPLGSGSSGSSKERLLEAALRMQLEMQRQLSSTMEAQRQLQKQLEEHGRYIEGLLRSEGALSSKPPAPKAATGGKPRASGPMHRRSGSSCSAARPRSASGAASPALEGGLPRLQQQPASLAALQLPPLALPVPPLPPGWHGLPHVAQQQMAPQQAQQMQQAQHAEGWLDQLLPAGDAQRAEQEATATQLSPADVDLLLAADSGSLPQLLHRPSAPAAASRQQAQGPAASHFSQRSQLSDGTHVAPGGAAGPPAGQAQQAQQAMVGGDISADIWDSLLADSGLLHQIMADEGQQGA